MNAPAKHRGLLIIDDDVALLEMLGLAFADLWGTTSQRRER